MFREVDTKIDYLLRFIFTLSYYKSTSSVLKIKKHNILLSLVTYRETNSY